MRNIYRAFRETAKGWYRKDVRRMGTVIAYYAAFSLVPMLLTIAVLAGVIFTPQEVENEIVTAIRNLVGQDAAQAIRDALKNIHGEGNVPTTLTVFNVIAMLIGATGLFRHLKAALNAIWEVECPPAPNKTEAVKREVWTFIKNTLVSLLMVLVVGVALMMWLTGSTALFYFVRSIREFMPDTNYLWLWQMLGYAFMFLITSLTFAVIYKLMPDADIDWRDVAVGAVMTSLLFLLGQNVIVFFISQSSLDSLYGTASLLTFILVWVFVSSHLVLFGAELTKVYSTMRASGQTVNANPLPASPAGRGGESGAGRKLQKATVEGIHDGSVKIDRR